MNKSLIYGKDQTQRVVSVEVHNGTAEIFIEEANGTVRSELRGHKYWTLYNQQHNSKFTRLEGDQYFKWMVEYSDYEKWRETIQLSYEKRYKHYTAHDVKTNFMLKSGVTSFLGMKVEDVSVLSFDIETTGLDPNAPDAQVLLISNTFRKNGKTTKCLFCVDDYASDADMIADWCEYVQLMNPSIVLGHYILGFDLPYLKVRGGTLPLGRDESGMVISDRTRQKRKDSSQSYDFNDINIYGREVIDTKFLAINYDIARNFPNYSLKPMIEFLGLQKKDRTFVDASKMKQLWADPSMRQKIKDYALDDSEDALKLYDLMAPSFFYYAQHVPMSFQQINNTATGTQINNFMLRAYLQDGQSIPQATEATEYEGAISFGVPGIHKNVLKLDIKSNYPNIMLQFDVFPYKKDPKGYMRQMLEHFTEARLVNKSLAKETGDKYYESLSETGKVFCNSVYGFSGAQGLNFNNPSGAAHVTRIGRELIKNAIFWASGGSYEQTIRGNAPEGPLSNMQQVETD